MGYPSATVPSEVFLPQHESPKDAVPQKCPLFSIEHFIPGVHLYTCPQQCLFTCISRIPSPFFPNTPFHIPPHASPFECPPMSPVTYLLLVSPAPSSCCPFSNTPKEKCCAVLWLKFRGVMDYFHPFRATWNPQ